MNEEEYPNEIDLGRKVKDYGECVPCDAAAVDEDEKTKVVYPSLYISDVPALLDLPKEGCCMIKYRRVGMSENERNGNESMSVELEILKICHADEEDDTDMAEKMRAMIDEAMAKK